MKKLFSISMPLCLAIVLVGGTVGCSLFGPEPERIVGTGNIAIETASSQTDGQSHDIVHARVDIAGRMVSAPLFYYPWLSSYLYKGTVEVQAGVPFDVTVYTFVSQGVVAEDSEVVLGPSRAVIYVFDSFPDEGRPITLLPVLLPRTDTITFSKPGKAEVVIRGKAVLFVEQSPQSYELRFPVIVTE